MLGSIGLLKFTRVTASVSVFSVLSFFSSLLEETSGLKFLLSRYIATECFFCIAINLLIWHIVKIMSAMFVTINARSNIMLDVINYDVIYDCRRVFGYSRGLCESTKSFVTCDCIQMFFSLGRSCTTFIYINVDVSE